MSCNWVPRLVKSKLLCFTNGQQRFLVHCCALLCSHMLISRVVVLSLQIEESTLIVFTEARSPGSVSRHWPPFIIEMFMGFVRTVIVWASLLQRGPATIFEHNWKTLKIYSQGSCEHVIHALLHCIQQGIDSIMMLESSLLTLLLMQ